MRSVLNGRMRAHWNLRYFFLRALDGAPELSGLIKLGLLAPGKPLAYILFFSINVLQFFQPKSPTHLLPVGNTRFLINSSVFVK